MPGSVEHRAATPIIKLLRNVLRGRPTEQDLRYADELATRSPPHPLVPDGPYHKTSKVYYFSRDVRREVQPPIDVFPKPKQLMEGASKPSETLKLAAPSEPYNPN